MTTEAWVKRDTERHELLQRLMQKVSEMESSVEGADKIWLELDLIQILATHLQKKVNPELYLAYSRPSDSFPSSSFFFCGILPAIEEFGRGEEEKDWLFLELMRKLLNESVAPHFHGRLTTFEQLDPKKIFQAPSAMTEVPIDS